MNWQLPHNAEYWLYENHPRAWGYLKALIYEDDGERRQALMDLVLEEDMDAIKEAYEQIPHR